MVCFLKKSRAWGVFMDVVIFALVVGHILTTSAAEKATYTVEQNLVYGTGEDVDLTLDLARPAQGTGPFPTVVFLFGGGYRTGTKRSWADAIRKAAQRGYVAVAIDYRLTSVLENDMPKYPFPAQISNGKCAIRWLRSHADTYAIDSNRIGVVGYSAGANLALMLGFTEASDGLEGNCGDGRMSSRVQAIINIAGVTDWVMAYHDVYPKDTEALLSGLPEQVPERYTAASPLTYVNPNAPPVLSIYGTYDPLFPQGKLLVEKMKAVGASHTLIIKEGVGHAQFALVDFSEGSALWEFLDRHLKTAEE